MLCLKSSSTGRHTSFRLASSLSVFDWLAFFSFSLWRSSSSLAFFSSSVSGAISSVDSEKSVCSLGHVSAWGQRVA